MRQHMRTAITFGVVGGLLTFIFGGWAVAILGILMGVALGFFGGGQYEREEPYRLGRQALAPAAVSGAN